LHDAVCVLPTDLHGAIGTEGIHDNDLIAPAQAIKTGRNVPLLVEANDNSGYSRRRARSGFLNIHAVKKIGVAVGKIKLSHQVF
jgi:hypothetical protein